MLGFANRGIETHSACGYYLGGGKNDLFLAWKKGQIGLSLKFLSSN